MLKGLDKWKVLNSKGARSIAQMVRDQWGADLPETGSFGFLEGSDGDIFLISRDVEKLDLEGLRVDSLGLYFGQIRNGELRLSIEGSQIVGKTASKNIIELTDEEFLLWMAGQDIEKDYRGCSGFVLIRHGADFIACGKCKDGTILNFVPKARRIGP